MRILETSIQLFAERGFEACTMRDIAGAVGIKAPAIYNHYSSKEEVLAAAMQNALGTFYVITLTPLEELPTEDWLEAIVRGHVLFQIEHRTLARANDALLEAPGRERNLSLEVHSRLNVAQEEYVGLLRALMRLETPGLGKSEATIIVHATTAICDRVAAWYDRSGTATPAAVATMIWTLVQRMLAS